MCSQPSYQQDSHAIAGRVLSAVAKCDSAQNDIGDTLDIGVADHSSSKAATNPRGKKHIIIVYPKTLQFS